MRPSKYNKELQFFIVVSTCAAQLSVLSIVTPSNFSCLEISIAVELILISGGFSWIIDCLGADVINIVFVLGIFTDILFFPHQFIESLPSSFISSVIS